MSCSKCKNITIDVEQKCLFYESEGKASDAENICSSVGGELPFPKNEQENTDYYNAFITINKHAKNGVLGKFI